MPNSCQHCGVALAWATRACPRCGGRLGDPAVTLAGARPLAYLGDAADAADASSWAADAPDDEPGWAPADDLAPAPVDDPTVVGRVGPPGWWSQPRHRNLVAITACGVILGVAVGLAFGVGNQGVEPNRVVPAARKHRRVVAALPTVPTVSPDQQREVAYLGQLESILQRASPGRTVLVGSLQGAPSNCAMPPVAALALVHTVVLNRTSLLNELGALPAAPSAESQ
jgi:hypothetical protein